MGILPMHGARAGSPWHDIEKAPNLGAFFVFLILWHGLKARTETNA